ASLEDLPVLLEYASINQVLLQMPMGMEKKEEPVSLRKSNPSLHHCCFCAGAIWPPFSPSSMSLLFFPFLCMLEGDRVRSPPPKKKQSSCGRLFYIPAASFHHTIKIFYKSDKLRLKGISFLTFV
uniref:Uncharacterized protein n=1 Tax=Anolis carolinensis TaxID=28377 RepID=A0A803T1N5_ANOCA